MGATQSTSHATTLTTSRGKLNGIEQRDKSGKPILQRYTKVPYALPPTGDLRWRRPQSLSSDFSFNDQSGSPGDYTTFGPICPQPVYNTDAALINNPNAAPPIENTQDEDCLYLNIWVPAASPAPSGGWPVQFHIHGGWLQVGDANQSNEADPFDLLASSTPRIIVSVTYRLNLFGFLAGAELGSATTDDPFVGNYGLWDQRKALEWTYQNISLFGGNPKMITVGGLSAGAHSAFLQLYYDTYLSDEQRIIKQVYLWSNAIAIQPNLTKSEVLTEQFNSLCDAVDVPRSGTAAGKVAQLRKVDSESLISAISKLSYHTFRSSTDGSIPQGGFIPYDFLLSINDGSFATLLAEHNIRIMVGEMKDEALLYKLVNPPSSRDGLIKQLSNYYPRAVVSSLVSPDLYKVPKEGESVPAEKWADIFATIVADCQVYASIRGLTHYLLSPPQKNGVKGLPPSSIFRYRMNWRAKAMDGWLQPKLGVCHASDAPIWWASGFRAGFDETDRKTVQDFLAPFGAFIEGKEEIGWGATGNQSGDELRIIDTNGVVKTGLKDEYWTRGIRVWDAIWNAQKDQ